MTKNHRIQIEGNSKSRAGRKKYSQNCSKDLTSPTSYWETRRSTTRSRVLWSYADNLNEFEPCLVSLKSKTDTCRLQISCEWLWSVCCEEEFFQYFLSLIKTLALRVKPEEMHLLFTANEFPILRRALMLSAHGDQMVRAQARTTYLTILRGVRDEQVREKAIELAQEMLLFSVRFIYRNCMKLHAMLWRGGGDPTTQRLGLGFVSYSKPIVTKVWA